MTERSFKPLNKFLILSGIVILLLLIVLLSLPTFFSTRTGQTVLSKIILNRYSISAHCEELSLSWFGSQKIKGLKATTLTKDMEIECEQIQTNASLFQLLLANSFYQPFINADVSIQNGKITFLPPFSTKYSAVLLKLIGPSLTIDSDLNVSKGHVTLDLNANSAHFNAQMNAHTDNGLISLNILGQLQVNNHPGSFNATAQLQEDYTGTIAFTLSELPTELLNLLDETSISWPTYLGDFMTLQGNIVLKSKQSDCELSLQTPLLSIPALNLTHQDALVLTKPAPFTYQIPPSLLNAQHPFSVPGILQQLKIPKEHVEKTSLQLQLNITPELFNNVWNEAPELQQPFQLHCVLDSLTTGKLIIDQFQTPQITLEKISLPFQWDPQEKLLKLGLKATTKNAPGDLGSIEADALITHFSYIDSASFECKNISTALIDTLTAKTGWSELVGSKFNTRGKIHRKGEKQHLKAYWVSPYLTAETTFSLDSSSIQTQGTKNQIQWTLTPKGYQALDRLINLAQQSNPFELIEKSIFSLVIDQLYMPFPLKSNFTDIKLSLSAKNPQLNFLDKTSKGSIELTLLTASIDKTQPQKPLSFSFNTSVVTKNAQTQNPKTGTITLNGAFVTAQDLSKLTSDLSLKMQQFPTSILDIAARVKGRTDLPFSAAFGPTIDSTLLLDVKDFNGPFSFTVNSMNTRASFKGTLNKGAVQLDQIGHAQIRITPEMSKLILQEINPLDLSFFYSEGPITFQIHPEQFSFPLYPFDENQITISHALIELGKITCHNEGNIKITLGLLKSHDLTKNKDLELWFAPLDLHIQKGIVDVERTEILIANKFDIAIWGDVDLPKNYLDMKLGLTATTLHKAFGLKNLPDNYVLTLPMKGPLNNVKIDSSKATKKIGLLLAWQQADKVGALSKGPTGAIVGGLLNRMATLPDKDAKVPPAKRPFPWEIGEKKKKTSDNSQEKMRHFKQNEKPLKQLLKVIR